MEYFHWWGHCEICEDQRRQWPEKTEEIEDKLCLSVSQWSMGETGFNPLWENDRTSHRPCWNHDSRSWKIPLTTSERKESSLTWTVEKEKLGLFKVGVGYRPILHRATPTCPEWFSCPWLTTVQCLGGWLHAPPLGNWCLFPTSPLISQWGRVNVESLPQVFL